MTHMVAGALAHTHSGSRWDVGVEVGGRVEGAGPDAGRPTRWPLAGHLPAAVAVRKLAQLRPRAMARRVLTEVLRQV